ncbi:hypothetical protein BD779DRAFT_1673828 [Infundibulicybe gibba]|nr:hypothetical protein BD779DRAFT_1673828 [Infundibulicybe gibba]
MSFLHRRRSLGPSKHAEKEAQSSKRASGGIENVPPPLPKIRRTHRTSANTGNLIERVSAVFRKGSKRAKGGKGEGGGELEDADDNAKDREPDFEAGEDDEEFDDIRRPSGLGRSLSISSNRSLPVPPSPSVLFFQNADEAGSAYPRIRASSTPNLLLNVRSSTLLKRRSRTITLAFPDEVLTHVLEYLRPALVASMATVSRNFLRCTRTVLYRTISSRDFSSPRAFERVLELITHRPDLGKLVQTLECHSPVYLATLTQALVQMTALITLTVSAPSPSLFPHITSAALIKMTFLDSVIHMEDVEVLVRWLDGRVGLKQLVFAELGERGIVRRSISAPAQVVDTRFIPPSPSPSTTSFDTLNISFPLPPTTIPSTPLFNRPLPEAPPPPYTPSTPLSFPTELHLTLKTRRPRPLPLLPLHKSSSLSSDPRSRVHPPSAYPSSPQTPTRLTPSPHRSHFSQSALSFPRYTPPGEGVSFEPHLSSGCFLPELHTLQAPPSLALQFLKSRSGLLPLQEVRLNVDKNLYDGLRPSVFLGGLFPASMPGSPAGVPRLKFKFASNVDRRTVEKVLGAAGVLGCGALDEQGEDSETGHQDVCGRRGILVSLAVEVSWESEDILYKVISTVLPRYIGLEQLSLHLQRPPGSPQDLSPSSTSTAASSIAFPTGSPSPGTAAAGSPRASSHQSALNGNTTASEPLTPRDLARINVFRRQCPSLRLVTLASGQRWAL